VADQISFTPGETVKIISGPFATLTGIVKDINQSRQMLVVTVQLSKDNPLVKVGSGDLPIELRFREVKKVTS
jgi:transcription antitermination factor NusG